VAAVLLTACSSSLPGEAVPTSADNIALSSFAQSSTADKASLYSTTTTAAKQAPDNPLRKDWNFISDETKRILEECGISYEDIVVDKSRLIYDHNRSLTDIHPEYSTYSLDDKRYSFNDINGKLTFVSLPKDFDFAEEKSEEEIRQIAATFADLFIDIANYEFVGVYYDEALKNYSIEYRRVINGYRTHSGVGIDLSADGRIGSFSICKVGLFDDVTVPIIDKTAIRQKCGEILSKRYDDLESFEVDFTKSKLDIKDGQLLAYYQKQPEIEYGQWVMICECKPHLKNNKYSGLEYVLVPLGE
jgi:hypothetical protein